jgi:dTDP-4-dehydrorhamnose reductase
VYAELGADQELVRGVSAEQARRPARRPTFSVLGNRESAVAGLAPLRPWREALAAAVARAQ